MNLMILLIQSIFYSAFLRHDDTNYKEFSYTYDPNIDDGLSLDIQFKFSSH